MSIHDTLELMLMSCLVLLAILTYIQNGKK